jgi:hypothetical protein
MGTRKSMLDGRLPLSQRTLQVVLGSLWIFDAALQYQPRMFGHEFVDEMIAPMAAGQPPLVSWVIETAGHLIRPDVGVWNFLFATVQLAIGVGLLYRPTVRAALVAMFAWSMGVWWVGEGLGGLLTGHASPFTGAPGAVIVYALVGLLAWPRSGHEYADAPGLLGRRASLGIWAGLWSLSALLWLQPADRAPSFISSSLRNAAAGEPGWYAHRLTALAGTFQASSSTWAWLLAAASLVIGLGPLAVRPSSRWVPAFFLAGILLEAAYWVTGQALGGVLTGMGTDPNTGPLVALLALAVMPAALPAHAKVSADDAPAARRSLAPVLVRLTTERPLFAGTLAAGLGAALLIAATYPEPVVATASAEKTASSQSSISTSGNQPSGASGVASSGGMAGMDMGGSPDSSSKGSAVSSLLAPEAMGATDPTWHYYGPPLPPAEVSLLETVSKITDQGHKMQTPTCSATPTAAQLEMGIRIVQDTSADVAKYKDLSAAIADGYIPVTSLAYPVVHYVKLAYMQDKYVLDPSHVDSLVYATTPYGPVLVAAMYLMPSVGEPGPMPAGCMLQWHSHTNLCTSTLTHLIVGFTPCAPGTVNYQTPMMSHVWQVPVPGGPLELDPSDLQAVEAAVMAQQCGEAPYNPATPPPPPAPGECAAYYGTGSANASGTSSSSSGALDASPKLGDRAPDPNLTLAP